ncbi:MAG: hypothetical protein AB7P69_01500 [Candidatus Binatia bacterium]
MKKSNEYTLLELMQHMSDSTLTDTEVVETVVNLINNDRIRLRGKFAGARVMSGPALNGFLARVRSSVTSPAQISSLKTDGVWS